MYVTCTVLRQNFHECVNRTYCGGASPPWILITVPSLSNVEMHGSSGPASPSAIVPHGLLSKYMVKVPPLSKSNNNPIREPSGIFGAGSKVMPVPLQVLQSKPQPGPLCTCVCNKAARLSRTPGTGGGGLPPIRHRLDDAGQGNITKTLVVRVISQIP